jgi:hypothetical protein
VGSNPSAVVIEATPGDGSANYGVLLIDKDFVIIDGLHITRFRTNVFVTGEASGSNHATVRNCRLSDAFYYGVHGWDDVHPNNDVTITGNLIEYNGSAGVKWTRLGSRGVISYNRVYSNGQLTDEETYDPEHDYRAGISLWGDGEGIEDIVVEHNDVEFTGMGRQPIDGDGNGIWVDRTLGGNIIRYNVVRSSAKCGIIIEDVPLGGMIYYNVSVNNGGALDPTKGFGLLLMRGSEHWEVYNNTVFGNANGLGMGNWSGDGIPNNNTVVNNIVFSSDTREIHVVHGAEDLSNEFEYNFIDEGPGFVKWGSALFGLLGSWESAAPQADNNATGEPGFVDPASGDFRLEPGSPCLDAGIDVGLEFDIEGMPVVGNPTLGAYENPLDPFVLPFTDGFESGDLGSWPDSLP